MFLLTLSSDNVANDGGFALQHFRILEMFKIVVGVTVTNNWNRRCS